MVAIKSMRALVTGRVQGVGFRYFTQHCARRLQLQGYVRNLPNGGVEVGAVGAKQALLRLVEDLQQGPVGSRVNGCQVSWGEAIECGAGFEVRY